MKNFCAEGWLIALMFGLTLRVSDQKYQTWLTGIKIEDDQPFRVAIIDKQPVLACGNEGGGGDIYMLRFSQGNMYQSLQIIINHDDGAREFTYQEKDNKSLDWAKKDDWLVVSMKNDWKVVFSIQRPG